MGVVSYGARGEAKPPKYYNATIFPLIKTEDREHKQQTCEAQTRAVAVSLRALRRNMEIFYLRCGDLVAMQ